MKKIQIITLQNSFNYGAYLQAYALKTYLEKKGYSVLFYNDSLLKVNKYARCLRKNPKIGFFNYKMNKKYINVQKTFLYSNSNDNIYCSIIGSDEVWNVRNNTFPHIDTFIGKNINSQKVITYAVSSNNSSYEDFIKIYPNYDGLKDIDKISVRDITTKELCNSLGRDSILVVDPTLLITDMDYPIIETNYENYVLVYGYLFMANEINEIISYAKSQNKKIISVGFYQKWADKNIIADPFEFLGLLKNSSFVFTSTFHGTILAVVFKKQFRSFARENQKIINILKDLDICEANEIYNIEYYTIDYYAVYELLKHKRKQSIDYLEKALRE